MVQGHCRHLTKDTLWLNYEPDWIKGREDVLRTRIIHKNSNMILTFDLEKWFQVTAHPFTKGHFVDDV